MLLPKDLRKRNKSPKRDINIFLFFFFLNHFLFSRRVFQKPISKFCPSHNHCRNFLYQGRSAITTCVFFFSWSKFITNFLVSFEKCILVVHLTFASFDDIDQINPLKFFWFLKLVGGYVRFARLLELHEGINEWMKESFYFASNKNKIATS